MTLEEMQRVAVIMSNADGGCPYCVDGLRDDLANEFHEFTFTFDDRDCTIKVRGEENGKA